MSRNNTGNPIGSKAFPDFEDNVPNFDLAMNSKKPTWLDRFGELRPTYQGAVDPTGLVQQAVDAAGRAEMAAAAQGIYPSSASGQSDPALSAGDYFWVESGDLSTALELWRKGSGSPTPTGRGVASSDAVSKPNWVGRTSGWPDPFFRHLDIGEQFAERIRWRGSSPAGAYASWEMVANPIFNGRALRKKAGFGNSELSGPVPLYVDEIGASVGDTVTIRMLIVGDGAVVAGAVRPQNMDGATAGPQKASSPTTITASSVPQLLTFEVPVTAETWYIRSYPYTLTEGKGFDIVAMWAYKGAASDGPSWPIVSDTAVQDRKVENALTLATGLRGAVQYAIIEAERLVFDSENITLNVTNPQVNQNYSLPFRGWGEIYTPAGVQFNAIRAMYISRSETPPEGRWSRIGVLVKSGVDANSGTVVAVGSVEVNPNEDVLESVTILLTDPVTGEVKTLDDSDLGPQYFIGVYAETADGEPAAMSTVAATLPNSLGSSYYLTLRDHLRPWRMTAGGGTTRVGFQHLLLENPALESYYKPTEQFKEDVGGPSPQPVVVQPLSWVPPKIYVTQGVEGSVYLDNLIADDAEDYAWSFTGTSQGQLQHERWTINPTGAVSAASMKLRIHDKRGGSLLTELAVALVGSAANAGGGTTRRVQLIGDSFANAGHMTQALLDNATGDVMGIELIGTRGAGLNRHEGRGGWRIDDYATAGRTYYQFNVSGVVTEPDINSTRYSNNGATFTVQEVALTGGAGSIVCSVTGGTPSASGTLAKISGAGDASIVFSASSPVSGNPFWVGGKLDYSAYLLNNSLPTPETVFIELGVNDVFGQTSDSGAVARAAEQFVYLDQLIASIKTAGVAKVALIPASGPSGSQDAFGASYGTSYARWRVKRNFILWNQSLVEKYSGQESTGIYISPAGLNWDVLHNVSRAAEAPVNSRSTELVRRMNNGVHPAVSGYQQIGDAMWAFLKCTA